MMSRWDHAMCFGSSRAWGSDERGISTVGSIWFLSDNTSWSKVPRHHSGWCHMLASMNACLPFQSPTVITTAIPAKINHTRLHHQTTIYLFIFLQVILNFDFYILLSWIWTKRKSRLLYIMVLLLFACLWLKINNFYNVINSCIFSYDGKY